MKILIIEDDDLNREIIESLLISKNHDLITASDGEKGSEMINCKDIDLVLLDLDLPKINGLNIVEKMRNDKDCCDIPVIIISGCSDVFERIQIQKNYNCECLVKPIHLNKLLKLIDKYKDKTISRDSEILINLN